MEPSDIQVAAAVATAVAALATVALAVAAFVQITGGKRDASENRRLTIEAMTDQTIAMLLRTLASDVRDLCFRPTPAVPGVQTEEFKGWSALRDLWIRARHHSSWVRKPTDAASEHETARKVYDHFLARAGNRMFGDVESIVRIWALSARMLQARGIEPSSNQGLLIREFHPKELGFVLYIIAMVRKEKDLVRVAKEFRLLDRCVIEEVLDPFHRDVLFAIDS
jgi:hypothetical protein